MSDPEQAGLSEQEREALAALENGTRLAPALEARILERLAASGLIGEPAGRRSGATRPSLVAAAAMLVFLAGVQIGRWSAVREAAPTRAEAESWLLLLQGAPASPEPVAAQQVEQMGAWAARVGARGVRVEGAPLDEARWLLDAAGSVASGPAAAQPAAEAIGGYVLLSGLGFEQALQIARSCPYLDYGGRIELRRVAGAAARS